MIGAADSFGSYGRRAPLGIAYRAAQTADRVVTGAIVLVLATVFAVAGYALWDSFTVLNGGAQLQKPTDAESFAALRAQNPDVCAWLTVDNTNIDYPVVQGEDNFEYLDQDATGEYSASGSIFLDSECDPAFTEPYEVVMGHHMQYGKMFGDLDKFLEADFFNENGSGQLMLPDRTLDLQVVAVLTADAYDGVLYSTPAGKDRMEELVSRVRKLAIHQRSGSFSPDDQLIALSTCASSGANARTVLICRVSGEHASQVG